MRSAKSLQTATFWTLFLLFSTAPLSPRLCAQEPGVPLPKGNTDRFGKLPQNQTEVFVAADVPPAVDKAVRETLAIAVKTWGSSGRLEYWVLGTDHEAAIELSRLYCKRRVSRGHMTRQACIEDRNNRDHGFLMYQKIGKEALSSGRPRGSAGHNGGAEWGFHNMTSSLPLGFAGKLDIPGEGEQVTLLHEYWHSVQNSFIQTENHRRRRELMGPVWFVEGSAVAMAETTASRLWQEKKMKRWNNSSHPFPTLLQRMKNKMNLVQEKRQDCATVLPDSYDSDCRELAYEAGAWALVYLMHRQGRDILLKGFHPRVEKLGWKGAFQATFEQSPEAFEVEFENFLDQPWSEQLKILDLEERGAAARIPPSINRGKNQKK